MCVGAVGGSLSVWVSQNFTYPVYSLTKAAIFSFPIYLAQRVQRR